MKRSAQVPATLIVALAAGISATGCGCDATYVQQCEDASGRILPDSSCSAGVMGSRWVTVQRGGFGGGGSFGGG